jgi:hypothetical protein
MPSRTSAIPARQPWVAVADPSALADVLRRIKGDRSYSTFCDAARARGIRLSTTQLSELLGAKRRRIRLTTLEALLRLAGRHRHEVLAAIEGEDVKLVEFRYRNWLTSQEGIEEVALGLSRNEARRLRQLASQHSRLRNATKALVRLIKDRGISEDRYVHAMRAAIMALNSHFLSGGVEPGLAGLTDAELGDFVAWGLQREVLLLNHREGEPAQYHVAAMKLKRLESQAHQRREASPEVRSADTFDFLRARRRQRRPAPRMEPFHYRKSRKSAR